MLLRSPTLAAASLLLATCSFSVPALALNEQQKKEMGAFIREYLIDNPEIMIEVQTALEAKQQAKRVAQSNQAVAQNRSEERRVGKEWVSTGRSRWSTEH